MTWSLLCGSIFICIRILFTEIMAYTFTVSTVVTVWVTSVSHSLWESWLLDLLCWFWFFCLFLVFLFVSFDFLMWPTLKLGYSMSCLQDNCRIRMVHSHTHCLCGQVLVEAHGLWSASVASSYTHMRLKPSTFLDTKQKETRVKDWHSFRELTSYEGDASAEFSLTARWLNQQEFRKNYKLF